MSKTHRLEPGDWIGSIAHNYGLRPAELWEHPLNAPIRELRGTPNLLMVGDEIQIPEPDSGGGVEVPTQHRVVFRRRAGHRLRVRVAGVGMFVEAFGPLPYHLELDDDVVHGEFTPESGEVIDVPLPPSARKARLTVKGWTREIAIGGLGPVHEVDGAHGRLINLGFAEDAEGSGRTADAQTAVLRFQRHEEIEAHGELDPETCRRLASAYGDPAAD